MKLTQVLKDSISAISNFKELDNEKAFQSILEMSL